MGGRPAGDAFGEVAAEGAILQAGARAACHAAEGVVLAGLAGHQGASIASTAEEQ